MNRKAWVTIGRPFRRAALPLASYYAVVLALPLAHGASPSGDFLDHALMVLLVPPVLILVASVVRAAVRALVIR